MIGKAASIPDLVLTVPILLLISLGTLVIYSSDPKLALQQAIFAVVGLAIYWFLSMMDFENYHHFVRYFYIFVIFLLVVVFVIGYETRGSIRWIPLGMITLQPSEFAKPILILFLAQFWAKRLPNWKNIFLSLLWTLPMLVLIFRQPDLGTTLTALTIWLIMLLAANISVRKIMVMALSITMITPIVWLLMKDYQKVRLLSFFSPEKDPLGVGYNVIQATIAVGSGQLLGRGLGRGTQSRLQFLPEYRTDFIFASIAEELGFLGSLVVLTLYSIIIIRCLSVIKSTSKFGNLIIFGVLGMLLFQTTINIGMNVGIVPITGITLPLISYGGSSLVATLISLSLVASVIRFIKFPKVDPEMV